MFFVSANAKGTSYHVIPLPICFWFDPRKSLRNAFYLIENELLFLQAGLIHNVVYLWLFLIDEVVLV